MNERIPSLRIALVASSLSLAGAEKQCIYIARALSTAGVDVRVFYLGTGGHYADVLKSYGIPLCHLHVANRPCLILARLIKSVGRFRPHMILVPQFGDLLYGGTAGRLSNSFVLGGIRSNGFYELKAHPCRSRIMIRLPHGLIANSFSAKRNLASTGVAPGRIQVLPNVIDLEEFDSRALLDTSEVLLPQGRIIAAAVGSLQPSKRFDRFLKELALARREEPLLFGLLVGADRGAKADLQKLAMELGLLPHHVVFAGESDAVPALLARADMLILSSDYEGFPNVILEAMAAGLPVVTTEVGDANLIVQEGLTGYVVATADVGGIADRMTRLSYSPDLRIQFGITARQRVEQEFSFGLLAGRFLSMSRFFAAQQGKGLLRKLDCLLQNYPEADAPEPSFLTKASA